MARSANQKLKLLLLRQYLERNSDEEHPVSTAQLLEYLASEGISAERKSIYSDMEALQSFGLDLIRVRDGNSSGWYIGERVFQLPELRLLADSGQSSRFITRRKSMELIAKLEGLASVHQAKSLRRQVVVKNRIKAMNESIYYLVDELHAAINGDKLIRFHYAGYDGHGRRVLRRGGAWYDVSPYALLWDDENYYLVGYDSNAEQINHYRVDKMLHIQMSEEAREGKEHFKKFNMADYAKKSFGMFGGKEQAVKLLVENSLAGVMIDRFGKDIMLIPADEEHFTVNVDVHVSNQFLGWIFSLGEGVKIVSPPQVVEQLNQEISRQAQKYNGNAGAE